MRASTLLGLALALIFGLVAVAGIRYSGILNRAAPKVETVMVLAAKHNLYEGMAATSNDVGLRPATPEELDLIKRHPEKVLPANPEAAHLRILARNVPANELLLKEYFQEMSLPPEISKHLAPGMRAVEVELPKDRAGAGLLRLGEYVDVFLTSKVCTDASGSQPRSAIAAIARGLKIVVKRNSPYPLMIPVSKDEPVSYILEANPYRAALIEFSKSKGNITLVVSSGPADNALPAQKEQELVDRFVKGESSVTESDLERIFHLAPLPPVQKPLRVEQYTGGQLKNVTVINPEPSEVPGEGIYCFFVPGDSPQPTTKEGGKKEAPANNISVHPTQNNKKN